jgi:sugar phosphate permease
MSERSLRPRFFYGWYVLAASFVILFVNTGGRASIGVMVKPMTAEFGWSRGAVSSAIFLNLAVYALSVIITGRLYDRFGPKWIIAGSTVLFSAGYALMAQMDSLWEFLLYYGVLNASGLAGTTVALFGSLIGRWFEKRRGLALSLAFAGTCFGQFFLVPVFSDMIVISGWQRASLWIAGVSLVVNLVLTFGVIRGDPEQLGLQPYGRQNGRRSRSESPTASEPAHLSAAPRDLTLAEAMRSRSLWLFTAAMFACGGADFLVSTHLVPMVTDYGLSTAAAASMLAWLGLLSLAGVLLAGPAADAIGNKLPTVITFALRVVLFVMLVLVKGAVPFWVFSLGFGLTLLVTAPLALTLVGALYGTTHIGFISGFIVTVHTLGGGLWAYLGGVIFDKTGNYDLGFILSAALAGVALICTLLVREERHLPPSPRMP